MTVSDVYPSFLRYAEAERNHTSETLAKTRDCFRSWILPAFADIELDAITRVDLTAFRQRMAERHLGISRQYGILCALRAFFKYCTDVLHQCCIDPARDIPLPHRPKPIVRYLEPVEIAQCEAVLDVNTFTGLRLRALWTLLLYTGMRIGEALTLNREPFEHGVRELEIVGKGRKPRTVYIPDAALIWIRRLLKVRADGEHPLFVTTGTPPRRLARADVSKFFKKIERESGIGKRLTPHVLRHTFCTNLLHNGVDISIIRQLAGHENIATTARYYLGTSRALLRRSVDRLNYSTDDITVQPSSNAEPEADVRIT